MKIVRWLWVIFWFIGAVAISAFVAYHIGRLSMSFTDVLGIPALGSLAAILFGGIGFICMMTGAGEMHELLVNMTGLSDEWRIFQPSSYAGTVDDDY